MKFNCGNPEKRHQKRLWREQKKRDADGQWHTVFAWLPKRVGAETCVWLENYERRIEWRYSEYFSEWIKYDGIQVRPLLTENQS